MRKQPQLSKSQKRRLKKLEVCAYAEIWEFCSVSCFVYVNTQALICWLIGVLLLYRRRKKRKSFYRKAMRHWSKNIELVFFEFINLDQGKALDVHRAFFGQEVQN